uniref:Uncharacterized protein AlNc14C2G325 n=1 Tax=Albugo laibachii Nc14 TaxID=890382 RepID=F0VZI7_9STRA|nr:conserved hypothetical protein [Albugo laibachii Nc14]|eukprot:CCA14217.1 conserved hypothetical protein [Albugo laibachii Nc14]
MFSALKRIPMRSSSGSFLCYVRAPCNRMKKSLMFLSLLFILTIFFTLVHHYTPSISDYTIRPTHTIPSAPLHQTDVKSGANQTTDHTEKNTLREQSEKAVNLEIDREELSKTSHLDPSNTSLNGVAGGICAISKALAPYISGYIFGFLGSIPVAGPTSAMVLRLGIQRKYRSGLAIASGGAIAEAVYAGIAFWGFGSFLDGASVLLPISKVLGALALSGIGIYFIRSDFKPPTEPELRDSHRKKLQRARDELLKNALMGFTISGINPALLVTYTAAIASIYSTGMLTFNFRLAMVFSAGVSCGIFSWFYLLLALLRKYKQRLKNQTIVVFMRGMGFFLLLMGFLCAKSAVEYFVWGY